MNAVQSSKSWRQRVRDVTEIEVSEKKKGVVRMKAQVHEIEMRSRNLLDKLLGR